MADYKGGYQIIDLTGATAGDPVTIGGIFTKIESNKGKPILIKANDGQRVFAQAKEVDGDYVLTYLSAEGKTVKVVIDDEDAVTTTIADDGASIEQLGIAVNEINNRLDESMLGTLVDISSYNSLSNLYTLPSDGYLQVIAGGLATNGTDPAKASIGVPYGEDSNMEILVATGGANQKYVTWITIPAKKGMKVYAKDKDGAYTFVRFFPAV